MILLSFFYLYCFFILFFVFFYYYILRFYSVFSATPVVHFCKDYKASIIEKRVTKRYYMSYYIKEKDYCIKSDFWL